jgi:hypothetical protein
VQHRQEDGAFDSELEAAVGQEVAEDGLATGLLPEAFEDQGRADAASGKDGQLAAGLGGEQQGVLGEAGSGGEQRVELTGGLQVVEPAEGGEDALLGAAVVPGIFDELEVAARARGFDAEEQGGLGNVDTMIIAGDIGKSTRNPRNSHHHVAPGH